MTTTTTTGETATNAAFAAGFTLTFRAFNDHSRIYLNEMRHPDGRGLVIYTWQGGAFEGALGVNRSAWTTDHLSVGTLPGLRRLLAAHR